MFKRSRRKIILAIMGSLILLFAITLSVITLASYREIRQENMAMLKRHVELYYLDSETGSPAVPPDAPPDMPDAPGLEPPGRPPLDQKPDYQLSTFYSVAFGENGAVLAVDNGEKAVYSEEELIGIAKEILAGIGEDADKETKRLLKQTAKAETKEYSKLKKLRWPLLMNSGNLSEEKSEALQKILQEHRDLAVCDAMKEEMCRLYELTDYRQALDGWMKWFEAAKASEIPALVKFAEQKEKRLPGLAAHAVFTISTGKLEGFNNKIKVAKRIAYGYRDEDYFFTLIRYLSLPSVRYPSHNFP